MTISNRDIQKTFESIADLMEILDENAFKVRAYRNAARIIGDLGEELADLQQADRDLTKIKGVGKDLADRIDEMLSTGNLEYLDELKSQVPDELPELLLLPGIGPKKARALWQELGVSSTQDLEKEVKQGNVEKLPGFGAKTQQNILKALASPVHKEKRFIRALAEQHIETFVDYLGTHEAVMCVEAAGSYRRGRDTVGDIDLLVAANQENATDIFEYFVSHENVTEILAKGETKSSVQLKDGLHVDLRVVPPKSYGSALLYFTGSKAHNIVLRRRAQERGLKINEWGVFREDDYLAGASEEDVYATLDLPVPPPELREDRGEFDAMDNGMRPTLITQSNYCGNLHAHSTWSDGKHGIEEIACAARDQFGYEYWAVTDHSKALTIANGLDEDRLADQIDVISELNEKLKGITILKGIECDILEDGSLDLSDDILKELDIVIVSVHSKFNLSRDQQTERIMRAMDNPYATFVAHPTGRLLTRREPYDVDVSRLIGHAAERGCWLELNASPWRLDLNDTQCRQAKEQGVPITINSDAHRIVEIDNIRHGIAQARRGWLEADDVVNTRGLMELKKLIDSTKLK